MYEVLKKLPVFIQTHYLFKEWFNNKWLKADRRRCGEIKQIRAALVKQRLLKRREIHNQCRNNVRAVTDWWWVDWGWRKTTRYHNLLKRQWECNSHVLIGLIFTKALCGIYRQILSYLHQHHHFGPPLSAVCK